MRTAAPTRSRLKGSRSALLRKLGRESVALVAFTKALGRPVDRAALRARDRLLRELSRPA